jgi:hypothetical protein
VADQQKQAASPSDLQISPDFPKGKSDQSKQAARAKMGIGSVYDVWVKFI